MLTAEQIIEEIYLLPIFEREKVARHIIRFGINASLSNTPEFSDLTGLKEEIAKKPFNLKEASEYLGISPVMLRRWIDVGKILPQKSGKKYCFDFKDL